MTNDQKTDRRAELLEGLKPELRVLYSGVVDMIVELEHKIGMLQKTSMMNKKLHTIAPEAQLYKQLTGQYAELLKELSKASAGMMEKSPLDVFFEDYMTRRSDE